MIQINMILLTRYNDDNVEVAAHQVIVFSLGKMQAKNEAGSRRIAGTGLAFIISFKKMPG